MTPHAPTRGHLLTAIQSLLYLIVIAIFIVAFSAQPFRIPTGSMEPALRVGDFLLVDRQLVPSAGMLPGTPIRRGDIVVFHFPLDATLHLVKRVIGLPGDRVRLHGGRVSVNGSWIDEPYAVYRPVPPDSFRDNFPWMGSADPSVDARWWIEMRGRIDHDELVVPPGRYFVLGDNRNDSEDSRYWGFVDARAIIGKPFLVYFSLRQRESSNSLAEAQSSSFEQRLRHLVRWNRTLRIVR